MWLPVIIMLSLLLCFTASALYGFFWSAKTGQFSDMDSNSTSIFGADEPLGQTTDVFPGEVWTRNAKGKLVKGNVK
jgi:cbb3-type cytochrome oxidase maturation protein